MDAVNIGVPIFLVVALAEWLLSGLWASFYFRFGIPIFRRSTYYGDSKVASVDPDELSRRFDTHLLPSIVFRYLGPQDIAFRERFLRLALFHYAPVMRGRIKFDEESQMLTVTGYAYVFPVCFLAMAVALCLEGPVGRGFEVGFLIAAVLIFGLCYAIQAWRFNSVYKAVRETLHIDPHFRTD